MISKNVYKTLASMLFASIALVGCGDSQSPKVVGSGQVKAELPSGVLPAGPFEIGFAQPSLPPFVVVTGLAGPEQWGRWSESDRVVFRFASGLPKRFALNLSVKAFGPNAGVPVPVKYGGQVREMRLFDDKTSDVRLEFAQDVATDSIEISIPKPTVPSNGDRRALGVAFFAMKLEPLP